MQTCSSLIACLAKQLAARKHHLPRQLVELYEHQGFPRHGELQKPLNIGELEDLFLSLAGSYKKLFVVVDALDEFYVRQERKAFLSVLQALQALQKTSVRIFITSRPYAQDIQQAFETSLQVEIKATECDIKRFVRNEVEGDTDLIDLITPELKEKIISTTAVGARGMCVMIADSSSLFCD